MPLLKYHCKDCGNVFEELVSSAEKSVVCSKCGSKNVARHYQGKCYFGTPGSSGGGCTGSCASCPGCGK